MIPVVFLTILGLAYLNLGDKQKSLACYDRVVGAASYAELEHEGFVYPDATIREFFNPVN